MSTTTMPKRHRARWNANELNRLHNEYEMKELTVQQIASLHGRTVCGVMSKLQAEGLIDSSWNNARGWVFQGQSSPNQSVSLQPALQFDQDDDAESVEQDDPEDEDYVPEEEDAEEEEEDAEEEDDEEEFDPYSIKQKVSFLEQQVTNIFSFLQKQFPKQEVMTASM